MAKKIVNGVEVDTTPEEDEEALRLKQIHEQHLIEQAKVEYQEQRRREYPAIPDVVVAILEKIEELRPESMSEIMDLRNAIKLKYPKPQE